MSHRKNNIICKNNSTSDKHVARFVELKHLCESMYRAKSNQMNKFLGSISMLLLNNKTKTQHLN